MRRHLFVAMSLMLLMLVGHVALACEGQSASQAFNFRKGQAVYISAFRRERAGYNPDYPNSIIGYICNNDIGYEGKIREEFGKLQYFKVVDKVSDAEFVFLVNIEYNSAEGFSLSTGKYTEWKDKSDKEKSDIDALRETSYKGALVGPFKLPTTGKISSQLAKKFHTAVAH